MKRLLSTTVALAAILAVSYGAADTAPTSAASTRAPLPTHPAIAARRLEASDEPE